MIVKQFLRVHNSRNSGNCVWSMTYDITYNGWHLWSLAPGEPTLKEKAEKFVEQLDLGDRPDVIPKGRKGNVIKVNQTNPVRQRRAAGLPVACPASQSEKSVCSDITGKQHNIWDQRTTHTRSQLRMFRMYGYIYVQWAEFHCSVHNKWHESY